MMEFNLEWRHRTSSVWPDVGYEIRPLKVWAFQELLAYWEENGSPAGEASQGHGGIAVKNTRLMEIAKRVFPDHVRNLEGISLRENGKSEPATVERLCEETLFMPLAGELISSLIAISETGEEEEKN